MNKFRKITIIGVGLIGGSVGLAIKKKGLAREVIGVFRRPSTLSKAKKCNAVDRGTISIKEGVSDADLIILATPVHKIVTIAREVIKYAKSGAIITDVGSTKAWIVNKIENMLPKNRSISFVGSHPMAGSEKNSVEYARRDLLRGTPCIVTRTAGTDGRSLKRIADFWKTLGSKVKIMSPLEHDKSVSLVSHLPHVVAFSLAGAVSSKSLDLAAEGYKDTTRIASSDPELWADIFLTNRREIAKACKAFEKYYGDIKKAVARGDHKNTVKLLRLAKSKRDRFIYAK